MRSHYSVIIVGAGPTGLVLANLLGKSGIPTLVVEANEATVGEPRAVSIDDESLRVIEDVGLLDVVGAEIVAGYGSEYYGPDGSLFLKVKPQDQPYGHPRRNAFRQPILEDQLRHGLDRYDHVEIRFECAATQFSEESGGVRVELRSGGAVDHVKADYLIGCDGAWSTTRAALGYRLEGSSLDERWLIIDLEDSPVESPETIVFCDPRRPGIALPGPRRTRRYEFKLLPPETDEQMVASETVRHLLETHGAAAGSRIIRTAIYRFHARIADHWGRGRIWLAGDAAHLMPPFAGQGMNAGIRDAANLAWKLAAVVQGRLGPRLLLSYERERRGHVASMTRLAVRMGTIFGPRSPAHGFLIRSAFRLLSLWPSAKEYFAEMRYKPPPRFDGGFLLEDQLTRRGIVGRMLPRPPLPSRYGGSTLDELLGNGFSLLGIDVDPEWMARLSLGPVWDELVDRRVAMSADDLPQFAAHRGRLLLLRPDRYVMARLGAADLPNVIRRLEELVSRTRDSHASSSHPDRADPPRRPAVGDGGGQSPFAEQGS